MKCSELIKDLQECINKHGDLEISVIDNSLVVPQPIAAYSTEVFKQTSISPLNFFIMTL